MLGCPACLGPVRWRNRKRATLRSAGEAKEASEQDIWWQTRARHLTSDDRQAEDDLFPDDRSPVWQHPKIWQYVTTPCDTMTKWRLCYLSFFKYMIFALTFGFLWGAPVSLLRYHWQGDRVERCTSVFNHKELRLSAVLHLWYLWMAFSIRDFQKFNSHIGVQSSTGDTWSL